MNVCHSVFELTESFITCSKIQLFVGKKRYTFSLPLFITKFKAHLVNSVH